MSLGGNKNEFCIENVELLQLCFISPLVYFLLIVFLGDRESSQCVLCQGGLQGLHLLFGCQCTMPELLKASRASAASQGSWQAACSWKPRKNYWGFPGLSLYFHYFPSFFCTLRFSALCSNPVLPLCWLPSAGNSSECPPPGNAPDDTVCVDMGKCKDGECVPFCEREKNLRSCACNGGWHRLNWNGTGTEICISSLLLGECCLHCGLASWRAEFVVSGKVWTVGFCQLFSV